MRLNKWLARNARLSRRHTDELISKGSVLVNDKPARLGQSIKDSDSIRLYGKLISPQHTFTYLLLNKPLGYVCSRNGQGKASIYDLLPAKYHHLKIAGRLDHDSSGLLLLTDDGDYILKMTHPRYGKTKTYEVTLNHQISITDLKSLNHGVNLADGNSRLQVELIKSNTYKVTMSEGRNRQIRRTFATLDYKVTSLHRTHLGSYSLAQLVDKQFAEVTIQT